MPQTQPFEDFVAEYEAWFETHAGAYQSELAAIRELLPDAGRSVEIGVGTGRFASRLGISVGVEPADAMRRVASQRGIEVVDGIAEALPFADGSFDCALMVTVDCFLNDVEKAFLEAHRILKDGGALIVGMIDRTSPLGRRYEKHKHHSPFYREATFHSAGEIAAAMQTAGFSDLQFRQTIFAETPSEEAEPVRKGHGEGAFVAIKGIKAAVS